MSTLAAIVLGYTLGVVSAFLFVALLAALKAKGRSGNE